MSPVRVFEYPKNRAPLEKRFASSGESDPRVLNAVAEILAEVRSKGDRALCAFTERFDRVRLTPARLRVAPAMLEEAWDSLPAKLKAALRLAKKRVEAFHGKQKRTTWTLRDAEGLTMTQRWSPLRRVGVYVPGGRAAYPSTVLMNVVPARVAGVEEIVAVTPPPREDAFNPATYAALHLCGVEEVYQVGGAQAVAALAYGTKTIRPVDKVVGPGNAYVAAAKRLLYGTIDIDAIAGPSEVMILADDSAPVSHIAADLLAQAEHDEQAQSIAVLIGKAGSAKRIAALQEEIRRRTNDSPRAAIIRKSLRDRGAIVVVANEDTAVELAALKAPEHLEIATRSPARLARRVRCAGSIFLGHYTPEPLGDYMAGPNHVLPTGGTARFASALSVDDFMRMTQIIESKKSGLKKLAEATITLAEAEGLVAHADTLRARFE